MVLATVIAAALSAAGAESEPPAAPLLEICADTFDGPACRIPGAVDAMTAQGRLPPGADEAFWVDGDVFHVVARRTGRAVSLCCSVQSAMEKLEPASDLWAVSIRVDEIKKAVLDVMILTDGSTQQPLAETPQWRGPEAPARALTTALPEEVLTTHVIDSVALAEKRKIDIYRPVGAGPMRVIYMADGESVALFARTIHPLILSGALPPVMIVGLHSGPADQLPGEEASLVRHQEYLPGWFGEPQPRFVAHDLFFMSEVLPLAEEMGASSRPEDRGVAGYSDGAAWALAMATEHPGAFGKVMALSFGWADAGFLDRMGDVRFGDVWLGAGTLEPVFQDAARQAVRTVTPVSERVAFDSRVAGHSPLMWQDQFPIAIAWLFETLTDRPQ